AFEAMGMAYIRFALANPSHYRVMFGSFVDPEHREPELAAEAAGAFQALVDALAGLQHDAVIRADDTLLVARFVWSVVHGVAMLAIDSRVREPGDIEQLIKYALERLRAGIDAGTNLMPVSTRSGQGRKLRVKAAPPARMIKGGP